MLKTMRLISVAAVAALALPAFAGSIDGFEPVPGDTVSQLAQPAYDFVNGSLVRSDAARPTVAATGNLAGNGAFEFVGGEGGWQLAQHKYVLAGGRFAMSDECDHEIRVVQAPTPAAIESTRRFSPGA